MFSSIVGGLLRLSATTAAQQAFTSAVAFALFGSAAAIPGARIQLVVLGSAMLSAWIVMVLARAHEYRNEPYSVQRVYMEIGLSNFGKKVRYTHGIKIRATHTEAREYVTALRWSGKTDLSKAMVVGSDTPTPTVEKETDGMGRPTGRNRLKFVFDQPIPRWRSRTVLFHITLNEESRSFEPFLRYDAMRDGHSLLARLELKVVFEDGSVMPREGSARALEYRFKDDVGLRVRRPLRVHPPRRLRRMQGTHYVLVQRPVSPRYYSLEFPFFPVLGSGEFRASQIVSPWPGPNASDTVIELPKSDAVAEIDIESEGSSTRQPEGPVD